MLTRNKIINQWFLQIITVLFFLCGVYLFAHLKYHEGGIYNTLSGTDITNINLLLNNNSAIIKETDTVKYKTSDSLKNKNVVKKIPVTEISKKTIPIKDEKKQTDSLKRLVLTYVFSKYPPIDEKDRINTSKYLMDFDKTEFPVIVSQYPFKRKSFFWLIDGWVYLEILFWSLLGLICSLLYNVSEAVKMGNFDVNELPVHLAKFFYTPIVALVIYLAMDMLTFNKELNVSQYGHGLIVFSYILGYFSRRAIELLDRIKEIILPGKEKEIKEEAEQTEQADEIVTQEIIEEAIKEKGEEWINSFPNVTGISIRNKSTNGKDTGTCALVFKVTKKEENLEFGKIPEYITYVRKDGKRYKLITDIEPQKNTIAQISKIDKEPFKLGISISREYDNETGTIGLLLNKIGDASKRKYILGNYHIFCAPELRNNNKSLNTTDRNYQLRCSSYEDDGTEIIGWVLNGKLDSESDFAIAELIDTIQFENKLNLPPNNNIIPNGFKTITWSDINKKVKMCGRTSEYKEGIIKSHYSSQKIDYGNNITQYIKGMVEITPISQGGDSGAVIVTYDNNEVIGIVVGGNEQSTYILPVADYIDENNYKLA